MVQMCVTGQWEFVTVLEEFVTAHGELVTVLREFCYYVSLLFMGNV